MLLLSAGAESLTSRKKKEKKTERSERGKKGEEARDRVRCYLEEGDIVIDRQEIVGGVSNDPFNGIKDAPVFVVTSCVESVNARRRTATERMRWYVKISW